MQNFQWTVTNSLCGVHVVVLSAVVRSQRSEVGGQKSEVGGQKSEVRSQKSDVRCPMSVPVILSGAKNLLFWVKGEGRQYAVDRWAVVAHWFDTNPTNYL